MSYKTNSDYRIVTVVFSPPVHRVVSILERYVSANPRQRRALGLPVSLGTRNSVSCGHCNGFLLWHGSNYDGPVINGQVVLCRPGARVSIMRGGMGHLLDRGARVADTTSLGWTLWPNPRIPSRLSISRRGPRSPRWWSATTASLVAAGAWGSTPKIPGPTRRTTVPRRNSESGKARPTLR